MITPSLSERPPKPIQHPVPQRETAPIRMDFLISNDCLAGEMKILALQVHFFIAPSTILYSNSRHSREPLKSGVRFVVASRMSLGKRMSALRK